LVGYLIFMHPETLAPKTKKLLEKIGTHQWLKDYYLAGGTALALQLGHRQSIDLDFFTKKNINTPQLIAILSKEGVFKLLKEEKDTVEGLLDGVKVSFMSYPYSLIEKQIRFDKNIFLASAHDIALMKLTAIAGRNTKKDFIDLFVYLLKDKKDIQGLLKDMKKKFKGVDYDSMHICKSLVYFEEADKEPIPVMFIQKLVNWKKVKDYFIGEVKKIMV